MVTGINPDNAEPEAFSISPNYPNPFNALTTIDYRLPKTLSVKIGIFDILGNRIDLISDGRQEAGEHRIIWNAADLSSGVYYYKIQAGDFAKTGKMLLQK